MERSVILIKCLKRIRQNYKPTKQMTSIFNIIQVWNPTHTKIWVLNHLGTFKTIPIAT